MIWLRPITRAGQALDRFRAGTLRDLRISVTDRCNFRCTYCMPREVFGSDFRFLPRAELLTFEEIARLARLFKAHGVEKIRSPAASRCCGATWSARSPCWPSSPGSRDLTLTTNGTPGTQGGATLKPASTGSRSASIRWTTTIARP